MKGARIGTILVAIVLIVGALWWKSTDSGGGSSTSTTTISTNPSSNATTATVPDGAVVVTMAYSPEKRPLLEPLVAQFNTSGAEVDGQKVVVQADVVSSGEATDRIVAGDLQPVLWSPSSSLWGRLVNFRTDSAMVPDQNPSLVRTPLVIAMWEPLARALGWPNKELGWSDILREARSTKGWAAYGHPEWAASSSGTPTPISPHQGCRPLRPSTSSLRARRRASRWPTSGHRPRARWFSLNPPFLSRNWREVASEPGVRMTP